MPTEEEKEEKEEKEGVTTTTEASPTSTQPPPPQAPADLYLTTTPIKDWSIVDYLNKNATLPFSTLSHSWVRALSTLKDSDANPEQKLKADTLLEAFKEGHDGRLAREWRERQKLSPGSVVIKNSFNHSKIEVNGAPAKAGLAGLVKGTSGAPRRAMRMKSVGRKRKRSEMIGEAPSVNKADIPSSEPENVPTLRPGFISSFTECYNAMSNPRKWLLPSGFLVEDILYEHFKDSPTEHAAHSWIIDTSDPRVSRIFDTEDWKAICAELTPLPETERALVESMRRFMGLQSPSELRNAVYSTFFLRAGEMFDEEKHQGPAWVDFVMRSFLHFYENPSLFDHEDNSENWYIVYVYSVLFDRCMLTLPSSRISRGESVSTSATDRKNPDPSKRKRVGHLYDGVLKIADTEAGACEHARRFTARKWAADSLKVVKVLHDMLCGLEDRVGGEMGVLRRLPVVGLVAAGLHHQLLRMNYARGHICLLGAENAQKIPTTIDELEPLFAILVAFWRHRCLMSGFKKEVTGRAATEEELVERLMGVQKERCERVLPRSVETDGE